MEKLGFEKYLQDYLKKSAGNTGCDCSCCCCSAEKPVPTIKERVKDAIVYTKDLMKKIWLFVLIGVGVGAFLHGYVPQEFFIKYMGSNNFFSVPLAVAVGIPLYADITTVIPIVQVLIDKGASIGTALVFMMSIVALSLPEMIILTRVMKKELIIRYVIFMFITFALVGYLYNLMF